MEIADVTGGATDYTDNGVLPGYYIYRVVAYDAAQNFSDLSNPAFASVNDPNACYDMNGNGVVTLADVYIVLNHVGQTGTNLIWDVNNSGAVTWQDVLLVLRQVRTRC